LHVVERLAAASLGGSVEIVVIISAPIGPHVIRGTVQPIWPVAIALSKPGMVVSGHFIDRQRMPFLPQHVFQPVVRTTRRRRARSDRRSSPQVATRGCSKD